jgi:hypothetical protein
MNHTTALLPHINVSRESATHSLTTQAQGEASVPTFLANFEDGASPDFHSESWNSFVNSQCAFREQFEGNPYMAHAQDVVLAALAERLREVKGQDCLEPRGAAATSNYSQLSRSGKVEAAPASYQQTLQA